MSFNNFISSPKQLSKRKAPIFVAVKRTFNSHFKGANIGAFLFGASVRLGASLLLAADQCFTQYPAALQPVSQYRLLLLNVLIFTFPAVCEA